MAKVALASGQQIVAPTKLVAGKRSPALKGRFSALAAYQTLLAGTGLHLTPVGAMLVVTAPPSDPPPADAVQGAQVSEVTVTGTRIRGQAPVGSNLIVIDRSAIDRSGYATTQQLLQALPQNFGGGTSESTQNASVRNNADQNGVFGTGVNLRGLGTSSTLVLLNGQRPALDGVGGIFTDLSMIPSSAIQRIEVLADGASAIYGSDAVAGVVNVIFRDDFKGAETRVRYGSADGDFGETQLSQLVGGDWGSGHAVFAYQFYDRGRLPAADRDYATQNLTSLGGPDLRSAYASPGTIVAGDQTYAIPAGSTGVGLTPSQLIAGQTNLQDNRLDTDILPNQQSPTFYGSLHQDLGSHTTVFAQGLFAVRTFASRSIPAVEEPTTVPTTNPFYVDPLGTGQPDTVEYSFLKDLGPQVQTGMVQGYDAFTGLDHSFGAWSAGLRASYALQREYSAIENLPNTAALAVALADTNPATAYNVFGSGGTNNPATVNSIRGYANSTSHSSLWSVGGKAEGPLFQLPAGALRLAFGADYREERYDYSTQSLEYSLTPETVPLPGLPGPRGIAAAYGEALVPIVSADMHVPAVQRLDLSLAGRVEHYSDFGTTANPKIGVGWTAVEGLDFRAAYGTSFRAPSFNDLRTGPGETLYAPLPLNDPKSASGVTNALLLVGNSSNIGPETATTWNAGVDIKPQALPGLKASLGYFDVDFHNRIAAPTEDIFSILDNRSLYSGIINGAPSSAAIAAYYASPYFTNPYNIAASSVTTIIDARVQNLARVHQDGFDFDVGYSRPIASVTAGVGVSGTYILHIDQAVTSTAPATDVVGTLGEPVQLRLRARASLTAGPYQAAAFVNFVDSYRNETVTPTESVNSWTTVDLQLAYAPNGGGLLHGVRLALDVTNLFNAAPPFVVNQSSISVLGYDADNASPIGRFVALELTKDW